MEYTRNFLTECIGNLLISITNNTNISANLQEIYSNSDEGTTTFVFENAISEAEEMELDKILTNWVCPVLDNEIIKSYEFTVDEFKITNNNNWPVSAPALIEKDESDKTMFLAKFDDTTEEGVGFNIRTPNTFEEIQFIINYKAQTDNITSKPVSFNLYIKELPNSDMPTEWQQIPLGSSVIAPGNNNWQVFNKKFNKSFLGIAENKKLLCQMTRNAGSEDDALVGDLVINSLEINFY